MEGGVIGQTVTAECDRRATVINIVPLLPLVCSKTGQEGTINCSQLGILGLKGCSWELFV